MATFVSVKFASKNKHAGFVDDCGVAFEPDGFSLDEVIDFLPLENLGIFGQIDEVEIGEDSLVCVISAMDEEFGVEEGGDMIGAAGYIFALDFDFGPPRIKGVFLVGFDD